MVLFFIYIIFIQLKNTTLLPMGRVRRALNEKRGNEFADANFISNIVCQRFLIDVLSCPYV